MSAFDAWLERLTAIVHGNPVPTLILAGAIVAALVRDAYHAGKARDAVERWAAEHRYRIVGCRRLWLAALGLRSTGVRLNATEVQQRWQLHAFAVTVADRELGGLSRGRVVVRRDTSSPFEPEVEVSWDALNVPGERAPAGPVWEDPQLALLGRVADGECTFRPDDRESDEAGERFDVLVEHLTALQRRGWVTLSPPIAETRRPGRMYAAVTDVEVTEAGSEVVARARR